jgi:hypothetical protein
MIEKITINKRDNEYYTYTDSRDGFLLCIPEKCSLDDFLKVAKVQPNSYASTLVSRLFYGLVTSSENVMKEYNSYYSKEYRNLSSFLFWKYCIPIRTSNKILSQMHTDEIVLCGKFSSGCSWTAKAFIENEIMFNSLKKMLIEIRRMYHEDSK